MRILGSVKATYSFIRSGRHFDYAPAVQAACRHEFLAMLRYHRLSVRRFTKTPTNYIFSESLIIDDYENVFR